MHPAGPRSPTVLSWFHMRKSCFASHFRMVWSFTYGPSPSACSWVWLAWPGCFIMPRRLLWIRNVTLCPHGTAGPAHASQPRSTQPGIYHVKVGIFHVAGGTTGQEGSAHSPSQGAFSPKAGSFSKGSVRIMRNCPGPSGGQHSWTTCVCCVLLSLGTKAGDTTLSQPRTPGCVPHVLPVK